MYKSMTVIALMAVVAGATLMLSSTNDKADAPPVLVSSTKITPLSNNIKEPINILPIKEITLKRYKVQADKVVTFNVEVDSASVEAAIDSLKKILSKSSYAFLYIDSPGGSVFDGTKLTAFIEGSNKPIYTVCGGVCASMGAHIFESGHKRLITDNGVLMFHPASGGLRGTVPEMKSTLSMIDKYTARMDAKVAKRAGIDINQFYVLVLQNLWVNADESISLKLADEVVYLDIDSREKLSLFNIEEILLDKALNKIQKVTRALESKASTN